MRAITWSRTDECLVVDTNNNYARIGWVSAKRGYHAIFMASINSMGIEDVFDFPSEAAAREHIEAVARTLIVGGLI